MLSGFLIGGQIIEGVQRGSFSFKLFYIKRSFRIFPPYYFSLLVVAVLHYSGYGSFLSGMPPEDGAGLTKDFLVHIFYMQDYIEVSFQSLFWSLFHTNFDTLIYGVLVSCFFVKYRNRKWIGSRVGIVALLTLSIVLISLSIKLGEPGPGFLNACVLPVITGIGFGALVLLMTNLESDNAKSFLAASFRYVARLSYTMYLYHLLFRKPVLVFLKNHLAGSSGGFFVFAAGFFIYFVVVVLLSDLLYRLIDRPFMNAGRRYISSILFTGRSSTKKYSQRRRKGYTGSIPRVN